MAERCGADIIYLPRDAELDGLTYNVSSREENMPSAILTAHLALLHAVQPEIMVWGEANYSEYHQIKTLIRDLGIRTQLHCVPTLRSANGIPVSAATPDTDDAVTAALPLVHQTLENAAHAIKRGARQFSKVASTAKIALKSAGFEVDAFDILDQTTMALASAETTTYRITTSVKIQGYSHHDSLGLSL